VKSWTIAAAQLSLLLWSSFAHAQTDDRRVYADYLFREGVRLMNDDRCPQAIPKFEHSQQLDPSAASLLNLATCYARLGRTATAWRTYRKAAAAAEQEKDPQLKEQAFKAISILAPTLTNLRVISPADAGPLSLKLNGEPITAEAGSSIPLDPGENIIEASSPGREPWRRSVQSNEVGATIVIEVPELQPRPTPPPPTNTWRTAGAITAGVGLSGIVAGLVLGISAKSAYRDSLSNCTGSYCNREGHERQQQAATRADIATVSAGLGAAAVGTGMLLWFLAPRTRSEVNVSVWYPVNGDTFGLSASGRL